MPFQLLIAPEASSNSQIHGREKWQKRPPSC
jgi:hypothetical protein